MKPLHNVTFCPTGFNDEDVSKSISRKILKLGGCYSKDLTRQVNVLVIGKTKDTNKYRFAVRHRHDIVFIDMAAIDVLYERWLAGDDIIGIPPGVSDTTAFALTTLRNRYSSGPLDNFYIFIGRIDSFSKDRIEEICHTLKCYKCNSSHFVKDCKSRNDHKTVVFIADSLQGARVEAAIEQRIPVVHYKWILDCQRRNAALEFDPYYLLSKIPGNTTLDEIGLQSCDCWNNLSKPLPEPVHNTQTAVSSTNLFQKFKVQGDRIWEKAMSRSDSNLLLNEGPARLAPPTVVEGKDMSADASIFRNATFHVSDRFSEKQSNILKRVIELNGGVLDAESQFLVIPSDFPMDSLSKDETAQGTLVTEFFIERCLNYKKLITPPDSWSKPFLQSKNATLVPSRTLLHDKSQPLQVAITGFHGVELLHLHKILKIMEPMGIKFVEYLNKKTDLLLINLSALPSIPRDHPLWKNQYRDLFIAQLEHDNNKSNQILRNSLKRKIQFVKQEHSVPVVTPAFLIDVLARTSNTKSSRQTVFLNNVSWCIICPRGSKESFGIELLLGNEAYSPDENVQSELPEKAVRSARKRSNSASTESNTRKTRITGRTGSKPIDLAAQHA